MNIKKIAETLNYEYVGNPDEDISGISFFDTAKENEIAIVKRNSDISSTKSRVVLTEPRILITEKFLLYTHEPLYVSAVKVAELLTKNGDINFRDFTVGENCVIEPDVFIGKNVVIGSGVILHSGAKIGASSFYHYRDYDGLKTFHGIGRVIISDNVEIGFNSVIQRGTFGDTFIGHDTKIGNLVDVGHDVKIGSSCKIVSQVGIAGNAVIGDGVTIFGQSGISNFVRIGNGARIMAKTLVTKNVKSGAVISGNFGRRHSEELKRRAKLEKILEVR